jgi:hypothetical protein
VTNSAGRLDRVRRFAGDLRTAARMPRVHVIASRGEATEEEVLRFFSRPHPRYRIVANKSVGAALLPLEDYGDIDSYLASLRTTRKRAARARRLGYTFGPFDPDERRSELLAIHNSLPERQGQAIEAAYLDPAAVYDKGPHVEYLGVFRDVTLVAYVQLRYAGEIVGLNRVMGHGDHLDDGIMFLLMAGVVEHVKATRPDIHYVFYDMFFGASEGLRAFKTHLGFRPHYVRWKREPAASDRSV